MHQISVDEEIAIADALGQASKQLMEGCRRLGCTELADAVATWRADRVLYRLHRARCRRSLGRVRDLLHAATCEDGNTSVVGTRKMRASFLISSSSGSV